jgi:predicted FMN-binding regulatory protein PaiB
MEDTIEQPFLRLNKNWYPWAKLKPTWAATIVHLHGQQVMLRQSVERLRNDRGSLHTNIALND